MIPSGPDAVVRGRPPRIGRWPPARAILAGLLAACLTGGPGALMGQSVRSDSTLERLMAEADIPGLAIAVVSDGQTVRDAALGVADAESGHAVTPETVFEAASLTKPVVAYTVLRLVERGELDLDRPLWESLPYPRLEEEERARAITARHVLSHTTGLPNWGGTPLRMSRAPGERWGYSGEGFVYLQRVLEERTGMPLADLVGREVFEPLGMTSSSLVWRPDYDALAARGHDLIAHPVPKGKPDAANAAGSLHTTALDYARFLRAVLTGEGLAGRTAVEMLSPVSQVEGGGAAEHARYLQWGLGWGIQKRDRSKAIWHWGDNGVFRCFVIAYPSEGRGLVYLTNSENGLAIAEDVVSRTFADTHHAIRWLDYDRWDDPRRLARLALLRAWMESPEAGQARLEALLAEGGIDAGGVETLVSDLANRGRNEAAVEVARRRVAMDPDADALVALGEALTAARRHEEALDAFRRALELEPDRRRAELEPRMAWLRAGIEARREPLALEPSELAAYAGDYGPRRVRLEEGRLMYSRQGSVDPTPLRPLSRELFELSSSATFRLRFVLGPDGVPASLVGSYADGREDETPRTRVPG